MDILKLILKELKIQEYFQQGKNEIKEVEVIEEKTKQEKTRWYNIRYRFGISETEYNELLEEQNHSCGICHRHEDEFAKRLAVDHDHQTGEIRGLLCTHCNQRFLGRHRNAQLFRNAAEYLERERKGWKVPSRKRIKKRSKRSPSANKKRRKQ